MKNTLHTKLLVILFLLGVSGVTIAGSGTYQTPQDFLAEVFNNEVPKPKMLWIVGEVKENTEAILGHPPAALRTRYWQRGDRSAWILEEIGKEKPITTGIVIADGRVEQVKVLIFRESRGWEVRRSAFTRQFHDATLNDEQRLTKTIDGITGATLSVRALKKLARLSLYYHQHISTNDDSR